ncbi:putative nucleic acid-binding Zn-ribbon protein [Bacillus sp. F9_6S_D1_P_5]
MIEVEGLQEVRNDVQEIRQDIKDIRLEIKSLEMRTTGNEKDIININKQLDKISANTTWILRLIVGGLIGAALTFLLKGGGM